MYAGVYYRQLSNKQRDMFSKALQNDLNKDLPTDENMEQWAREQVFGKKNSVTKRVQRELNKK